MQTGCGPALCDRQSGCYRLFGALHHHGAGRRLCRITERSHRAHGFRWPGAAAFRQNRSLNSFRESPVTRRRGLGENKILSCADAVAKAIQSHMAANGFETATEKVKFLKGACPDCGGALLNMKEVALSADYAASSECAVMRAFSRGKTHPHRPPKR